MEFRGIYKFIQFTSTNYFIVIELDIFKTMQIFINTNIFSNMLAVEFILSLNTFQTNIYVKFYINIFLVCFGGTLLLESNIHYLQ